MSNIHITIDLWDAPNKRAFAKFLEESAKADDLRLKEKDCDPVSGYAPESALPEKAQAAKVETKPVGETPIASMTVPQLKELADKEGINLDGATKKADIIARIEAGPVETSSEPETTEPEPEGETDAPEVQQQDAADEAAETEAAKTDEKLTLDDVRNVLGNYVKAYGMNAAQEDGPKLLAEVCGAEVTKVSQVPEDKIADVIAAIKKAGKENRFNRQAVAA